MECLTATGRPIVPIKMDWKGRNRYDIPVFRDGEARDVIVHLLVDVAEGRWNTDSFSYGER